jgi:hypothetical protein
VAKTDTPSARLDPGGGTAPGTWPPRAAAALRRHWLLAALLAAGLALRIIAQLAYHPALIYVDTLKYLYGDYPGADPLGYRVLLKIILAGGDLGTVTLVQHLLTLAVAVALYAVLTRRGVPRWLAALAVAPVLLDAYQLQMEQTIMPDVWFDAAVVAGLAVLAWRPVATAGFAAAGGLLLGASATIAALGELLIVPALFWLLLAAADDGWRRALARGAALTAAFALPIAVYCSVSAARTGHFWLARQQSHSGRLAAAADCATLRLPPDVRPLCPTPAEQAKGPDWLEHDRQSPLFRAPVPAGVSRAKLINQLDAAVEQQQSARVAAAIAADSVRLFALTRGPVGSVTPISRWQFQTRYPVYPQWVTLGRGHTIVAGLQPAVGAAFHYRPLSPAYGGPAQVSRPFAQFLRSYQLDGGYTPGPLLLILVLAGTAGSVLALGRRSLRSPGARLAHACLLFTGAAAVLLLVPDVLEFSWRYQLPAVVLLPAAGVLGGCALVSRRREHRNAGPADREPPDPAQPDQEQPDPEPPDPAPAV